VLREVHGYFEVVPEIRQSYLDELYQFFLVFYIISNTASTGTMPILARSGSNLREKKKGKKRSGKNF
jgi:hypothetical protein